MIFIVAYLALVILIVVFNHASVRERKREEELFQEGLDRVKTFLDENPEFLLDDEEDWYSAGDFSACTLCEDILFEYDAVVGVEDEEGEFMLICEYCLNPALKG